MNKHSQPFILAFAIMLSTGCMRAKPDTVNTTVIKYDYIAIENGVYDIRDGKLSRICDLKLPSLDGINNLLILDAELLPLIIEKNREPTYGFLVPSGWSLYNTNGQTVGTSSVFP